MIKNIIFDFGDIFINLDKFAVFKEWSSFGFTKMTPEIDTLAKMYEKGGISSDGFITELNSIFPTASIPEIKKAWNSILLDFPEYRLEFIEQLAKDKTYRLFLLSNTNETHIDHVIETMGEEKFQRFKNCFEKFYLSHEINLRKPDVEIYEFVLSENDLLAEETFFVDDTEENTITAHALGIKTWNLIVGNEDIINLKQKI